MFFVYEVPNMNPALGPVKGDKQSVSVYDRDLGNRRTIITTPDEADEFIQYRKDKMQDAAKRGWGLAALTTAAGAAAGAAVNVLKNVKEAEKLNELIEPLNKAFKAVLKNPDMIIKAKFETLEKDEFKNYKFKLGELFSIDTNEFKKIDIKSLMKRAGKYGAVCGALLTACFAFAIPFIKASNADKNITQAFIEDNK